MGDVASLTNGEQGFAVVVRIDRLKIDFRVNVTRALGQLAAQAYAQGPATLVVALVPDIDGESDYMFADVRLDGDETPGRPMSLVTVGQPDRMKFLIVGKAPPKPPIVSR